MAALFKQRVLFLSLAAATGTALAEALPQDLFGDLDGHSKNRSLCMAAGGACWAEPQKKNKAGKNEIKGKAEQTTGNAKESNLRFRTFSTKNDVFYHIYRCPSVNKERVLDFPGKKQYGTLFLFDKPNLSRGDGTPKLIKAQGSVKIPAGNLIEFLPNEHFIMAPHQLDKLPDDAFDAVRMKYFAMDDSEEGRADDALIYLGRFKTIKYLDLDRCEISDRGMEGIKNLPNLVTFTAMNSSITGKCFKKLGVLKELRLLKLQNTDPDLSCIADIPKAFPNLWHLCLTRTRITNKAIEPLAALKSLKRLDLAENSFLDDGCIPTLACLNSLNNLEIPATRITAKGLLKLKHLPLRQVDLSASNGKPESFEKLRHEMKSTVFTMVTKYDKPPVSENEQTLFAPLSRGRKL